MAKKEKKAKVKVVGAVRIDDEKDVNEDEMPVAEVAPEEEEKEPAEAAEPEFVLTDDLAAEEPTDLEELEAEKPEAVEE